MVLLQQCRNIHEFLPKPLSNMSFIWGISLLFHKFSYISFTWILSALTAIEQQSGQCSIRCQRCKLTNWLQVSRWWLIIAPGAICKKNKDNKRNQHSLIFRDYFTIVTLSFNQSGFRVGINDSSGKWLHVGSDRAVTAELHAFTTVRGAQD